MRRFALVSAFLSSVLGAISAVAAEPSFPFDHELRLDTAPKRGSKRIPVLQFSANGNMEIDLWCVSGRGTAVFADATIAIVPVSMRDNQCSPEQLAQDESLLNELTEMTSWRRDGEVVTLTGARTLRFRMSTN
jgi:hypothetical protein